MLTSLKISILSPEQILKESRGEVKKSAMLDTNRTPIQGGLFCERIFGPVNDYTCNCKKFRSKKHEGIVCDRCGVEVLPSSVRRERIGHINLNVPIPNPLFWRIRSDIQCLIPFSFSDIQALLNYTKYYVPGTGIISYYDYNEMRMKGVGNGISGGEALLHILSKIDIEGEVVKLREAMKIEGRTSAVEHRLKVLESFKEHGMMPSWTVLSVLPVIPPDLRPIVEVESGLVYSDITKMYGKVIDLNNRVSMMKTLHAPQATIRKAVIQLQNAVDCLYMNERMKRPLLNMNGMMLKSITGGLVSKEGLIRGKMLGKRVDYSGRSVIVPDPTLTPYQARIPREMMWEILKPLIINQILKNGCNGVTKLRDAEELYKKRVPEAEKFLDDIIGDQYVMLNRQPTLHRDGIQVFKPLLSNDRAIGLHPSYCPPFNADFDGDTMAIYVPLAEEARRECEILLHEKDVLSPATGKSLIAPTQEIVFGVYYATRAHSNRSVPDWVMDEGRLHYFMEVEEWDYNDRIKLDGHDTTIGRFLFNQLIPEEAGILVNEPLTKPKLFALIEKVFSTGGIDAALKFIDAVKDFGYNAATRSGLSFAIDDFNLEGRDAIIAEAEEAATKLADDYRTGKIMEHDRYNHTIDVWSQAADKLKRLIREQDTPLVWTMKSGARGKVEQVIQVCGMKGLVSEPVSGRVIETPVKNSFRQGLTQVEYFASVHGARKGLIDKGMKTAESGYLTRRLVDVAHGIFITEDDCGSLRGVYRSVDEHSAIGQFVAEDIVNGDDVVVERGTLVTVDIIKKLKSLGHTRVLVRTPITCESALGICAKCYGLDLSTQKPPLIGLPVGIIAAQSIGEPGTQMVLRSFHTGGAASFVFVETDVRATAAGAVKLDSLKVVTRSDGKKVTLTDGTITHLGETYQVPRSSVVGVSDGEEIAKGRILFGYHPYNYELLAKKSGTVRYVDMKVGVTLDEKSDSFGRKNLQVLFRPKYCPSIEVLDGAVVLDRVYIPDGAYIIVKDGDQVLAGDTLARLPKATVKAVDITTGLKDINKFFEAQQPKPPEVPAILSEIDGVVTIEYKKTHRTVSVGVGAGRKEYRVGYDRLCLVEEGDTISSGTKIADGIIDPHDILKVRGYTGAQEYLVDRVTEVYDFHGISVSKKHIEIIVRQMLSKVRVTDPGDSDFIVDEVADRSMVIDLNQQLLTEGKKPIQYELIILGISKVAMASSSFLSAISFQNTIRLMTDAALYGRRDRFYGMKENVMVGHEIPVSLLEMQEEKRCS